MKYVKQFFIILTVCCLGELFSFLIPLPIPGSIYGLILMFAGLSLKIIPYDSVKDTAHFLVEIMPVMFIPAAVGLLDSWSLLASRWLAYLVVIVVTTVAVMAVSGLTTQYMIRRQEKGKEKKGESHG